MSNENPSDLKYTKTHEWVRDNGDGTATIGITEHAQELLGDVVFVELPEVETTLTEEENCGVIESVKAASDMYAPLAGEVTEVNEELDSEPELINTAPFGEGWIFSMKLNDIADLDNLLSADEYEAECQE
ncbi:glycine cleavage system protein GcvH [Cocleimonas flava]|jgi:glycine cleavage system H protein|uniref:Glycine cleavage system H protein n=1 Tax=Cocleimonas flava TaxID=634765 RepID=A0A4R1F397_9GAMM|nr:MULTISPECIES: glycine cleavage system protein GcvH [Cocleimonas]MEB8432248.1 glycine cleavage system protein GcvH [Cocleimonas sp. KMM 6892]MEC4714666.1 glycine cleavage system protein GcvH [Cocleimonas sp. KMM 6895]MEC4744520.1 glycine cleavage system protein GcvH [Cocleimonas sp. KMM 6896]TCJ86889.1 glycine cleavage system H protein [Cocleimonas flava]